MQAVINLYKKHRRTVDNFIRTTIKNVPQDYIENADIILKKHTFFQLIYSVDENYHQVSPVICRKEKETFNIGSDKRHYFTKLELDENGFYVSNPYIHYRTGTASPYKNYSYRGSITVPSFSLNPSSATIHPVTVVPMFTPKMIPDSSSSIFIYIIVTSNMI